MIDCKMAAEEVAVDVGVDGVEEEEVVVRGRYNMVTDVDRRRLVNAFQSNQDWLTLASNLNIKRQTARNIYNFEVQKDWSYGRCQKRWKPTKKD